MILCRRSCVDILMVDIMKDHAKSKTIWQKKASKKSFTLKQKTITTLVKFTDMGWYCLCHFAVLKVKSRQNNQLPWPQNFECDYKYLWEVISYWCCNCDRMQSSNCRWIMYLDPNTLHQCQIQQPIIKRLIEKCCQICLLAHIFKSCWWNIPTLVSIW